LDYLLKYERRLDVALLLVVAFHVAYVWNQLWSDPGSSISNVWVALILVAALLFAALKLLCLLSPRRESHFGGLEILVFLALYGLTVLVFASLYNEAYLADPDNAFKVDTGKERPVMLAEINNDLPKKDAMSAEYKKYRLAETKAANEATHCYAVPPNFHIDLIERERGEGIHVPETRCDTDVDRMDALLKEYVKGIDLGLVNSYKELQRRSASYARLTYVDFLYFSAVTGATVGYGDITPTTAKTKLLVIGHIATSLFLTLVLVNLVVNPVGKGAGAAQMSDNDGT
jgi:hypothetical protein